MFFGLIPIENHPCCRMQEVVEQFFRDAVDVAEFSLGLFPEWIRATLANPHGTLNAKFAAVHALLHAPGLDATRRSAVYEMVRLSNCIEELCNGNAKIPENVIDWQSPLGHAITDLMLSLYRSLDFAVFRRQGAEGEPTHQLYSEFISVNNYVCPFCGLRLFKNKRGVRREDFDHYLHKSDYPLAAVNFRNLVPTCGICNQDYKGTKDILADGAAFYPYAAPPEIKVEIECKAYPATDNFDDSGSWSVNLVLVAPNETVVPKMKAWDRVYSIKKRLEDEIHQFFEEWMKEISDDHPQEVDDQQFKTLITSAKQKAQERARRRMEPKQIIKEAFYDFMLHKADRAFRESFRLLRNSQFAPAAMP